MVKTNKQIIRGLLMGAYLFIISILLFLTSSLYSFLNTGADRSKMLHIGRKKVDQYLPKINWTLDGNEGRVISKQTINELQSDYIDAWYVKQMGYKNNAQDGIKDYYTKNARKNIFNIINYNKNKKITVNATSLIHNLDIEFYSEDGRLIVLKDNNVLEYKKIFRNEKLILKSSEVSSYRAILLLEDGFWRIRHMVKEVTEKFTNTSIKTPIAFTDIKGINYYPQATPWNMYGKNFDIQIIEKDFKRIKEAGLNAIRIFIPYVGFGKTNVQADKLEKLQKVLDSAAKQNLKVIITLFDFYGNYKVLDWTLNHRHAEKIVEKFKDHEAILAWDIKNEPDLDFDSRGRENVIAWLDYMIMTIKTIDKKHPITIGWSNVKSATILQDKVDVVSFHYYEDLDDFEEEYISLKNKIKNNKPIILQEFGVSSYGGFWRPFASSEEKQANYYKEMQNVLAKNSIPFMSWTLYDFDQVPQEVVGRIPWRVHPQKKFGFLNRDGIKKPSFKFISK